MHRRAAAWLPGRWMTGTGTGMAPSRLTGTATEPLSARGDGRRPARWGRGALPALLLATAMLLLAGHYSTSPRWAPR